MRHVRLTRRTGITRTPKMGYTDHTISASKRGVPFLLTFEQWWKIWKDSGHWHKRGCRKGQYVMARFGDEGPYAVGNVEIITVDENLRQRVFTDAFRAKMSEVAKNRTPEHRANLSLSLKGKGLGNKRAVGKRSDEARAKMSAAAKNRPSSRTGTKHSEETKAKLRAATLKQHHPKLYG